MATGDGVLFSEILDDAKLSTWTKKDLVKWLVDHKQKKSGNKPILIKRVLRTLQFEDSECDSDWESDEDTFDELPNIDNVIDNWMPLSTENCPPTRAEDVENYFIYNKNPVTGKTQACHRQYKKARKFAKERYVHNIQYNELSKGPYCMIKAECKPSMKDVVIVNGKQFKNYKLHVVIITSTGRMEGGKCTCKPGLSGLCSHIGGLLLTIVNIKNACTSKGCEWLRPQSDLQLQPQRLRDIQFFGNEDMAIVKPYPGTYRAGLCQDPDTFLEDIMPGLGELYPQSVLFQTMNPNITDVSDIIDKYLPNDCYDDSVNLNSTVCQSEFRSFSSGIEIGDSEIERVKIATQGQSSNPVWKSFRCNLLTASNFGDICKKRPETQPDNLVKRLRGYVDIPDVKPLQYGRKKESQARRDYARQHMDKCGRVSVQTTGLVISKDFPFLGASVDGIVECDKCGIGAVEIKCPYTGRNNTPTEYSGIKNSCLVNENGNLTLKMNHKYMYQIMGQMKVLNLDWVDFVVWTKKGLHVERVHFNSSFWENNMMFQLKFFYNSFFLAELFTDRIKRGISLF